MATARLFLCILCFAYSGSIGMFNGSLLGQNGQQRSFLGSSADGREDSLRRRLVSLANQQVGVREATGNNDGLRVEAYLASVNLRKGQPWCAAYVSWLFAEAGLAKPRSGWSPDLFPSSRLARSALPGNLIGIYSSELKRIAHVGMIMKQDGDWIVSCEGNTNVNGSREGDGVYIKRRHRLTIYRMADWLPERRVPK